MSSGAGEEDRQAAIAVAMVAAAYRRVDVIVALREIAFASEGPTLRERLVAIERLREIAGLTGPTLERFVLDDLQMQLPQRKDVSNEELDAMVAEGRTEDLLSLLKDA